MISSNSLRYLGSVIGHNDTMPVLVSLSLDNNALRVRRHFQRLILSSDAHALKQPMDIAGERAVSMRHIPSELDRVLQLFVVVVARSQVALPKLRR